MVKSDHLLTPPIVTLSPSHLPLLLTPPHHRPFVIAHTRPYRTPSIIAQAAFPLPSQKAVVCAALRQLRAFPVNLIAFCASIASHVVIELV